MNDAQALSAIRSFTEAGGTVNIRARKDANGQTWQTQAVKGSSGIVVTEFTFAKSVERAMQQIARVTGVTL